MVKMATVCFQKKNTTDAYVFLSTYLISISLIIAAPTHCTVIKIRVNKCIISTLSWYQPGKKTAATEYEKNKFDLTMFLSLESDINVVKIATFH